MKELCEMSSNGYFNAIFPSLWEWCNLFISFFTLFFAKKLIISDELAVHLGNDILGEGEYGIIQLAACFLIACIA